MDNGRLVPRTFTTSNDVHDIDNDRVSIEPFLPGTFIVLQGMEGDGMQNTMDILPELPPHYEIQQRPNHPPTSRHEPSDSSSSNLVERVSSNPHMPPVILDELDESRTDDEEEDASEDFHHIQTSGSHLENSLDSNTSSSNSAMLSSLDSAEDDDHLRHQPPRLHQHFSQHCIPLNERTNREMAPLSSNSGRNTTNVDDSFVVIRPSETSGPNSIIHEEEGEQENQSIVEKYISEWQERCREKELTQLEEMQNTTRNNPDIAQSFSTSYAEFFLEEAGGRKRRRNWENWRPKRWWQRDGKLLVLTSLPSSLPEQSYLEEVDDDSRPEWKLSVVGELSPGATVIGTELVTLHGRDLPPEEPMDGSTPAQLVFEGNACKRKFEFLRIESPLSGYVLFRRGGYNYLGHGLPANYCNPHEWLWRVTCPDGAYVREGLELDSNHLSTLSYGSLVPVKARSVNEMGLCRLQVDLPHIPDGGWVSECLNPLSGQRGPILQQLPFPVPVLYRVILNEGAVIRKDKELSSPEVRKAVPGSILKVTGRAFSNYPEAQCVERLRLAGDEGWISLRLNLRPPRNQMVVEMVGIDGSFDPDNPGAYHINALAEVEERNAGSRAATAARMRQLSFDITSSSSESDLEKVEPPKNTGEAKHISESKTSSKSSLVRRTNSGSIIRDGVVEDHCLICLTEERNATIIHGGTGHIACCLDCARILKGRGDNVSTLYSFNMPPSKTYF